MTQNSGAKRKRAGDEGAEYTAAIMEEVRRLRNRRGWSAERLAAEMTAAGVPWTRDAVSNLETGRRKHIAVHELLALAYILETETPLELLAPASLSAIPVAPETSLDAQLVRAWFLGRTGPLRPLIDEQAGPQTALFADIREALRKHGYDRLPAFDGLAGELARLTASSHMAGAYREDDEGDGDGGQ